MKEKTKRYIKVFLTSILITEAVGGLSALLTRSGMKDFESIIKPALTPPSTVFPIVWSILFAVMAIGVGLIYLSPPSIDRTHGIIIYVLQLLFNFFWSIFFFNTKVYGFSFFWLICLFLLIALMIYKWYKVNKTAALLQIPYLLWVGFAGYLNYSVWMLNS